jgi:hypothetical protein
MATISCRTYLVEAASFEGQFEIVFTRAESPEVLDCARDFVGEKLDD